LEPIGTAQGAGPIGVIRHSCDRYSAFRKKIRRAARDWAQPGDGGSCIGLRLARRITPSASIRAPHGLSAMLAKLQRR